MDTNLERNVKWREAETCNVCGRNCPADGSCLCFGCEAKLNELPGEVLETAKEQELYLLEFLEWLGTEGFWNFNPEEDWGIVRGFLQESAMKEVTA